jgi:hypothetical protein
LHDLADENASSIPHTVEHGNVRLIPQPFVERRKKRNELANGKTD